jgi:hypothetical protein
VQNKKFTLGNFVTVARDAQEFERYGVDLIIGVHAEHLECLSLDSFATWIAYETEIDEDFFMFDENSDIWKSLFPAT